ncbi:hypothetical protein MHO82_24600 [Vibrio sp. Of7-15]|uniref:hypothetical protein n=1 Tax=Vibrio sp. Of7-15 TaxID=2724879 RepID=UPI001EF22BAE|nr:hypothetical protein [Vibrio sp. Of7-15]MCG7500048.1 hypothetical protein [Vibrio sp. Of7-15]
MKKQQQITEELEKQVKEAASNFMFAKFTAPLRLVIVWMKGVNEKLQELEQQQGGQTNG